MKSILRFILLLISVSFSMQMRAQLYEPVIFDGTWYACSTVKGLDGNYVSILRQRAVTLPDSLRLAKFEADGDILWKSDFDDEGFYDLVRIFSLPDGGYSVFDYRYYYRFDASGTLLLKHAVEFADLGYTPIPGDEEELYFRGVTQNAAGFQIFTEGHADAPTNSNFRVITQMDADMNSVWSYTTLQENYLNINLDMVNIDDKTYLVHQDWDAGISELWIFDNVSGALTKYPLADDFAYNNILKQVTGGIVSAGTHIEFSEPKDVLSKFNTDGDLLWTKEYTYYDTDSIGQIVGLAELPGGNLISLNLVPIPFAFSGANYVLRRYTPDGDSIWQSEPLFSDDEFRVFEFSTDGDQLVITGETYITDHTGFVLITDTLGNFFKLSVEGYVYKDENANGVMDAGEIPLINQIVYTTPDTLYAVTDTTGKFHLNIFETGTYDLKMNLPMYWDLIDPESYSITFDESVAGTTVSGQDFRMDYTDPVMDIQTTVLQLGDVIPGFNANSAAIINNFGNQVSDAGTVDFHHPSQLAYLGGTPYTSYADTILSYDYEALNPYGVRTNWAHFEVSADLEAGASIEYIGYTEPAAVDADPLNNTDTVKIIVFASFDPNHKTVSPAGIGEEGFIDYETEWLTYTIQFQNLGTAPAHFVYVVDTLDALLDMMSIQMIAAKHNYTMEMSSPNVVKWKFDDINLPDSLSDPSGSIGYICFRIKIKDAATIGDLIENNASIYFDYNPPVVTNTAKSTLTDFIETVNDPGQAESIALYPNPVSGHTLYLTANEDLQNAVWKITDLSGKTICTGMLKNNILRIPDDIQLAQEQYILNIITDKSIMNTSFIYLK